MSTVLDNVKRSGCPLNFICTVVVLIAVANLVIPGGSELIGMWGGEWDLKRMCMYTGSISLSEREGSRSIC